MKKKLIRIIRKELHVLKEEGMRQYSITFYKKDRKTITNFDTKILLINSNLSVVIMKCLLFLSQLFYSPLSWFSIL